MKVPLLPIIALAAFTAGAQAAETKGAEKAPSHKADSLEGAMKSLARDYKSVAKSVDDESKVEANRASLKSLIATAEKCAELLPAKAEKVPAEERAKFVQAYKAEIAKLAETFRKIDEALAKKDFAAAKAAVSEAKEIQKQDHKKFIQKK